MFTITLLLHKIDFRIDFIFLFYCVLSVVEYNMIVGIYCYTTYILNLCSLCINK